MTLYITNIIKYCLSAFILLSTFLNSTAFSATAYDEFELRRVNLAVFSLLHENEIYFCVPASRKVFQSFNLDKDFVNNFDEGSIEEKSFLNQIIKYSREVVTFDDSTRLGFVFSKINHYNNAHGYARTAYMIKVETIGGSEDEIWTASFDLLDSDKQFVKDKMIEILADYLYNNHHKEFDGYIFFSKNGDIVPPSKIKFR